MIDILVAKDGNHISIGSVADSDIDKIKRFIHNINSEYGTIKILENHLKNCGWPSNESIHIAGDICHRLNSITDIDTNLLQSLIPNKSTIGLKEIQRFLYSEKKFNIYDIIDSRYKQCFRDDWVSAMDVLFRYRFNMNRQGVGPGELLLSIFSPGIKLKKGDIMYPSPIGEIEIKGLKGRMGNHTYALKFPSTVKRLLPFFKYYEEYKRIHNIKNMDDASWSSHVKAFFLYNKHHSGDFYKYLIELRNAPLNKDEIKSLLNASKQCISPDIYKLNLEDKTTLLKQYIAALHITCYQHTNTFSYLMLLNDISREACFIHFKGNTIGEKLINVHRQIIQLKNHLKIYLSIDAQNGTGVPLSLV